MLKTLLFILMALIGLLLILYFVFPAALLTFAKGLMRRKGGLVQKSIFVDGRVWPYLEGGNPDKPTLILVHGFSGDKDNWAMIAPELKDDFHLIIPDLPGFGEQERVSHIGFDNLSQTQRFKAFVDALGVQKPHLGGNSMGGWIVLRYAMDYPDALGGLILIDNAGVMGTEESELQQLAADETYNPLVVTDVDDGDRFLAFVTHNPPRLPARIKTAFHADAIKHRQQLDDIFWIIAREMRDGPLNDRLGEVRAPTLIIWGRHDRVIDVSCVPVMEAAISGSKAVILEDIGHVPMVEAPKETAQAIKQFIRSL